MLLNVDLKTQTIVESVNLPVSSPPKLAIRNASDFNETNHSKHRFFFHHKLLCPESIHKYFCAKVKLFNSFT